MCEKQSGHDKEWAKPTGLKMLQYEPRTAGQSDNYMDLKLSWTLPAPCTTVQSGLGVSDVILG